MSKAQPAIWEWEPTVRRIFIIILLYAIPVSRSMWPVADPDIWWHLGTGRWIVENGGVPTTDPFSAYGQGGPWLAYSWLFEIVVYGLYQTFGLMGIVIYTLALSLLIAVALHALVWRLGPRFTVGVTIIALGLVGMAPLMNPRPWLISILFFIIEIHVLLAVRQWGDSRWLWFLPPLFVVWANIHIQFIYGLFVLGLFLAEAIIEASSSRVSLGTDKKAISPRRLLLVLAASAVATLVTPYHLGLYRVIFEYLQQTGPLYYISEFMPLQFRSVSDWSVLALTLGAAAVLGWRREMRPFSFLLLAIAAFVSFRVRRDVWFVIVAALYIIGTMCSSEGKADRFRLTKLRALIAAAGVAVLVVAIMHFRDVSERELMNEVTGIYPVAAAEIVEERGYRGPLYNHFNWGGYLIWRLPKLPVAMDGRTNLHGKERIERSLATWSGKKGWDSDPELEAARLVIADVDHALASLLRLDPRFELVYEDSVATVFVRETEGQ
jgi:hypothetical protein